MKIYIAGPISGLDHKQAFANFERAENSLRDLGFEPVNPMKDSGLEENGQHAWEEYMKRDIPLLCGCDAIYLLDGWETSRGAQLEMNIANELKIRTVFQNRNE